MLYFFDWLFVDTIFDNNLMVRASLTGLESQEYFVKAVRLLAPVLLLPAILAFLLFPRDERHSRLKACVLLYLMSVAGAAGTLFIPHMQIANI